MTTEETIQLIAKVLAWQDGMDLQDVEEKAKLTDYQDWAQQCFEDITGRS